jgi:hypothetical protein
VNHTETRTCILMPTCVGYLPAARISIRLIERFWPSHPRIFVCGLEATEATELPDGVDAMARSRDPRDWVGIVLDAANTLRHAGYETAFLILDDQGPLDTCQARHLDETLPGWMDELDAAYIGLPAWEQGQIATGQVLGPGYFNLLRHDPAYRWRFSLNPALWRLTVLAGVLERVIATGAPPVNRSCWYFEKVTSRRSVTLPEEWNRSSYRVSGRDMAAVPVAGLRRRAENLRDASVYKMSRVLQRLLRRVGLGGYFRLIKRDLYVVGPYPHYSSGFIRRGTPIAAVAKLLRARNELDLADAIGRSAPRPRGVQP